MKRNAILLSSLALTLMFSSCYTAKIAHGDISLDAPVVKVNSKKNHALIAGLVPLTNGYEAKKLIGDRKDYIVKTQHTFVDGLLELVTLSIYTPTTTTFYVPLKDVETK